MSRPQVFGTSCWRRSLPHGIEWASASVDTAYGPVSTSWRIAEDSLIAEVELPFCTSGTFTAPMTPESSVTLDGVEKAAR